MASKGIKSLGAGLFNTDQPQKWEASWGRAWPSSQQSGTGPWFYFIKICCIQLIKLLWSGPTLLFLPSENDFKLSDYGGNISASQGISWRLASDYLGSYLDFMNLENQNMT